MTCPHCHAPVAAGSRFCAACGHAISSSDARRPALTEEPTVAAASGDAPTRISTEAPTVAGSPSTPSAASGWLSASGSIDHGRFAPGAVLDGRYRIVGLLGRGGMGEVYRADDLRLGQSVALKFLPPDLGRDAARLSQFHNEVRTARQVSHANVCRVYDIGEIDHQIYLSMEYVDGEDLASLLRRIGRLPEDKAIEIARQICAGLAAAHERGVIHRDLKPANIMLDGSGRARIMDFSLAAIGEVTDIRSGTPAYMAPEQLAGKEVTARSDIYSLGLVLYELFTGRRAYDAKTLGDLIEQHASGTVTSPSDLVKTLDQSIERAILRCLEADPARRPQNALAVAASLPGGDPLAAALAAGETPSPEMVAAVGGDAATVSPIAGALWLVATVALLVATAAVSDRVSILSKTPFTKPPAVLADRAEEIRSSLGYTDVPVDRASGLTYAINFLNWADRQGAGRTHWANLAGARPAPIRFWYRTSPGALVPRNPLGAITASDPDVTQSGMTELEIDALGRLQTFQAAPPEVEKEGVRPPVDWSPLFAAAALDQKAFADATPTWTPPMYADERRAWQGTLPGTDLPVRVEAAAYRGRPTYFHLVGAWRISVRDNGAPAASQQNSTFNVAFVVALLIVAAVLGRANLKSGRADRRGAFRVAGSIFLVMLGIWLTNDHVRDIGEERNRLFIGIGLGLFVGGAMYLIYLALEPLVRRVWPTMLVGWSRALSGRLRDATIGRDLLLGTAAGVAHALPGLSVGYLSSAAQPIPALPDITVLDGIRHWFGSVFGSLNSGLQNGLINVLVLVLIREFVRRVAMRLGLRAGTAGTVGTILAAAATVALDVAGTSTPADAMSQVVTTSIELVVVLRIGLLPACVMFFITFFVRRMPITLDASRFYAGDAWFSMAIVVALAAIGFWLARADEPLLGKPANG